MKYIMFFFAVCFGVLFCVPAEAQYAAQKEAAYFATIKAVSAYKVDDEEIAKDIKKLREDERFNKKLQKMLDELNNKRSKNAKNRRVYEILKKAGKEIYDELS